MTDPDYQALLRRAARYRQEGLLVEAIASYKQLLSRWPQSPNAWYNLAQLQRRVREYHEALSSYAEALQRGVEQPEEVHLNRGLIFSDDLRRYSDAERELAAALTLNPAYRPALLNLANLHEDLGRREAAAASYERILELAPDDAEALARYANSRTFSDPKDPLIGRMRGVIAGARATLAERASVGFALGRALDACGEYAAAFEAYALANQHSRASAGSGFKPYDRSAQERLIERIEAAFGSAAPAAGEANERPTPIFVCGMFRSGSTLAEQLLAGHPRITPGGEIELLPQFAQHALAPYPEGSAGADPARLAALARDYRGALAGVFPAADLITDKRPDNFLYIGLIKRLFPPAKIVYTRRDPLDNCLSVYFLHLDQGMSYALDLGDTAHYYRQHTRLMNHWKALFGRDIFDLDYDALVREPRPVMERLLAFLGVDWNDRCLEPAPDGRVVRTASVWQVRQPLYQRSSGRARHYARQISGVRECLDCP